MKTYIVKDRPYKYVLCSVDLVGKEVKLNYRGFHKKHLALEYADAHCDGSLYVVLYKSTNLIARVMHRAYEFLNEPIP